MAPFLKFDANQRMFEKFQKIVIEETKDVQFIFALNSNDVIKISAHKKVLAASSPVFYAMFYGPLKECGDVKIVDVSPDAFREFLQLFYNNEVKLTKKNRDEVNKLIDKYDVEVERQFVNNNDTNFRYSCINILCYLLSVLFD